VAEPTRTDGRSTRWDRHRRERRLTIITAAVDAITAHGPEASTAQVAERAGVPRTHVYRHFDDKRALDLAVSAHVAREIGARVREGLGRGGTARAIIGAAIDAYLAWIEEHPNLYRFLAQHAYAVRSDRPPGAGAVDAKAAFATELAALLKSYLVALGVDPTPAERAIVGVVGLVDATGAWWLDRDGPPRDDLAAELTEQVWSIIERTGRTLGLELDLDTPLPPRD
jgi:AcrR family transcriptional regulator